MTKIFFIGAGKMACAIAGGMAENGFAAADLAAFDVSPAATDNFVKASGGRACDEADCASAIAGADAVILAVKPQQIAEALADKNVWLKDKLIISIAAGVRLDTLMELSGSKHVVRVMPNTPALVGAGMSAYSPSEQATAADIKLTEQILGSVGEICRVNENMMDAVTGVSGSGPAYVFDFIQALADGGVNAGLPRDIALRLAAQTVLGAAQLVIASGQHPAVLRDQVTSPGGTTAKALAVLENNAFKGIVIDAVQAAANRSIELAKQ